MLVQHSSFIVICCIFLFVFILNFTYIFATKGYVYPIDKKEYGTLKELAKSEFHKRKKEKTLKEKCIIVKLCTANRQFQVFDG